MKTSQRRGFWLFACALCLAMGVYIARNFQVTTSITHFMPHSDEQRALRVAAKLVESTLTKQMVLDIQGGDLIARLEAAKQIAQRLRERNDISWVQTGPSPEFEQSIYQLYFSRRWLFTSDTPTSEITHLLEDEQLDARADSLKQALASPTGMLTRRIATDDPLQLFRAQLDRLQVVGGGHIHPYQGQFFDANREHAFIFLGLKNPAFDSSSQATLLDDIESTFSNIQKQLHTPQLQLEMSGVNRFAVDSEKRIRSDIQRISWISTGAMILVFLFLFRRIREAVLSLLVLAFGCLFATFASLLIFGSIHGLTLAFGAALIGVAIDYPIHLLTVHACSANNSEEPATPFRSLAMVWPGLRLGCITTVAGLSGLAWTAFPGIRELALFAASGVAAALLATRYLIPLLMARTASARSPLLRWSRNLSHRPDGYRRYILAITLFAIALGSTSLFGLRRAQWSDDLRSLSLENPKLRAEEERVRGRISAVDSSRFVVVVAPDMETALIQNDEVAQVLARAQADGHLEHYRSLHSFLWSKKLQEENRTVWKTQQDAPERIISALERAGFRREAFSEFSANWDTSLREAPLSFDDLSQSELSTSVSSFVTSLGDEVAILSFVRDVHDADAVQNALSSIDGAMWIDQNAMMAASMQTFRQRTLELSGVGVFVIFVLLAWHYKSLRSAAAAMFPAVVAALGTTGILVFADVTLNLMHVMGLLLVISMGVDYGVFIVNAADASEDWSPTFLSIVIACLSTILSFGLLSMSTIPALFSIGQTVALGVLLALVFSPLSLRLQAHRRP